MSLDIIGFEHLACFAISCTGIYSVTATHQAEPGRTSRPAPGLFFCLAARGWGGIYSIAAIHQAEPGSPLPLRSVLIRSPLGSRTAFRVLRPAFSFCLGARDWGGIYSIAAQPTAFFIFSSGKTVGIQKPGTF